MGRPYICFIGDEAGCKKLMANASDKIQTTYIGKQDTVCENPSFFLTVLRKGQNASHTALPRLIKKIRETNIPVYVICTHDQYDGIRMKFKNCRIYKIPESGYSGLLKALTENSEAEPFELYKAAFPTVIIKSDNPYAAAFCAECAAPSGNECRIIIAPSSADIPEEITNGIRPVKTVIITENIDGSIPDNFKKTCEKLRRSDVSVIYADVSNTDNPPNNVPVTGFENSKIIGETLKHHQRVEIRRLSSDNDKTK